MVEFVLCHYRICSGKTNRRERRGTQRNAEDAEKRADAEDVEATVMANP
jgi:hypothetical protein